MVSTVWVLRHLARCSESGLALSQGCHALAADTSAPAETRFWNDLASAYKEGRQTAEILESSPLSLPDWVPELVRAGDLSGQLGATLRRCADILEEDRLWKKNLLLRITYPLILVHLAAVLPSLPLGINYGWSLSLLWVLLSLGLIYLPLGLVGSLLFFKKNSRAFGFQVEKIGLVIPGIRNLVRFPPGVRFFSALTAMVQSSARMETALHVSAAASGSVYLQECLEGVERQLKEGKTLVDVLRQTGFFSRGILQTLQGGELTGTIDEQLLQAAEDCREKARDAFRVLNVTVIVLAYAGAVFLILSAILLILGPMYAEVFRLLNA